MADIADDAQAHMEREAAGLIARSRKPEIAADGHCINCGDPVMPELKFCDATCREDHEHRETVARRRGVH